MSFLLTYIGPKHKDYVGCNTHTGTVAWPGLKIFRKRQIIFFCKYINRQTKWNDLLVILKIVGCVRITIYESHDKDY